MRNAIIVLGLLGSTLLSASASAKDNIDRLCEKRWPADYEMQEHCIGEQRQALARIGETLKPMSAPNLRTNMPTSTAVLIDAFTMCGKRWKGRHVMIAAPSPTAFTDRFTGRG